MKSIILLLYIIASLLKGSKCQYKPSSGFATDQVTLWQGNNNIYYSHSSVGYFFPFIFNKPPSLGIAYVGAALCGYKLSNTSSLDFLISISITGARSVLMSLNINPFLKILSLSFTVIATNSAITPYMQIQNHIYNPTTVNALPRATDSQIFQVTSYFLLPNNSTDCFQIFVYLTHFRIYQTNPIIQNGMGIRFLNYGTTGYDFFLSIDVSHLARLAQINFGIIIVNQNSSINNKVIFYLNLFSFTNSSYTTWNGSTLSQQNNLNNGLGIPWIFGPTYSTNCSIGLRLLVAIAQADYTLLFDFKHSSGFTSIQENYYAMLAIYWIYCQVECDDNSVYLANISNCQYCNQFIKYCISCTSTNYCTNCGVNTYFDSLSIRCICLSGIMVNGGCTEIVGCLAIHSNRTCAVCDSHYILSSNQLSCNCPAGFHMVTNICINITGCLTAIYLNNVTYCLSCNQSLNLKVNLGTCKCKTTLSWNGFYCSSICGDGHLFQTQQCDDGNVEDGDGCRSNCTIQIYYDCINTDSDTPSLCSYIYPNLRLSAKSIIKDTIKQNVGLFKFSLKPTIKNYAKMNFAVYLNFSCPASSYTISSISYSSGIILMSVNYKTDLQLQTANVTLSFNQSIVKHTPISLIFTIISQNFPLVISNKSELNVDSITLSVKILCLMVVLIFLISNLTYEMIGIETLHVFQIINVLNILDVSGKDQFFSILQNLRLSSNYAELFITQANQSANAIFHRLFLSQLFLQNIYVILCIFLLAIFVKISLWLFSIFCNKKYQQSINIQQKQNIIQKISNFISDVLLFPICYGELFYIFGIVQAQNHRKTQTNVFNYISQIIVVFAINFTMFYYCKKQFIKKRSMVRQGYTFYSILYSFILSFFIILASYNQYILLLLIIMQIAVLFLTFRFRIYNDNLHLASLMFNQSVALYWIVILTFNMMIPCSMNIRYYQLLGCLVFLALVWVLAVIRTIYHFNNYGWYFYAKSNVRTSLSNEFKQNKFLSPTKSQLQKLLNNQFYILQSYIVGKQNYANSEKKTYAEKMLENINKRMRPSFIQNIQQTISFQKQQQINKKSDLTELKNNFKKQLKEFRRNKIQE